MAFAIGLTALHFAPMGPVPMGVFFARWPDIPPYHESLAGAFGIPELMPPIRRRDFQGK